MPVVVDPEAASVDALLSGLPVATQGVDSIGRMLSWLDQHHDEYAVVLGPHVALVECLEVCEKLRVARPTVSVVLVREQLDTSTLTQAMKSGVRDVVTVDEPGQVAEAVDRARELFLALRGPGGARPVGRVVTVFSPKGGVGKTTIAVNLALALNDGGSRRVCLVDLDLGFGDVAITMQLFPSHSIEHAIGSEDTLDVEQLDSLLTRHADSLMVLAAPTLPDTRDRISGQLVTRVLRLLRETFDVVVVDTSPSFDEQVLTALDETDECVVVTTLDVPTLKNVKIALETMDALGLAREHRYLLLNRADDEVGIGPDKVESILGAPVHTQIASDMVITASTNSGVPVVLADAHHPATRALKTLATELVGDLDQVADPATPRLAVPDEEPRDEARRGRFRRRR